MGFNSGVLLTGLLFVVGTQVLKSLAHTFPDPVRRYSTDAVLKETSKGYTRELHYTRTKPTDWEDLNTFVVSKSKWIKAEKLCFHGNGGYVTGT